MDSYIEMYNNLPNVCEADERFVERDAIFAKLAPLLSSYNHQFGVCLVHAHCSLEPGEKLIGTGNISQPMDGNAIPHYPTRWLHTGDPFEFRTEPATPPPSELVSDFQKIVGDIGVLGLYFAGTSAGILELEWTEGRKNITKIVPEHVPLGELARITDRQ